MEAKKADSLLLNVTDRAMSSQPKIVELDYRQYSYTDSNGRQMICTMERESGSILKVTVTISRAIFTSDIVFESTRIFVNMTDLKLNIKRNNR